MGAQAGSPRRRWRAPGSEQAAGARTHYEITIPIDCTGGAAPSNLKAELTTTTTTALPTAIGTATARLENAEYESFSIIEIEATPELTAYLPVTMFEVYYQNALWEREPYGYGSRGAIRLSEISTPEPEIEGRPTLCGKEANEAVTRTFEIRAHVAGAETDPSPLTVDVPLRCVPRRWPLPTVSADGGTDTPSSNATADDGGGCAVGSTMTSSSAGVASCGTLMAFAFLARRRRR
ncbi:MAG TPA: hypothetical protein VM925_16675 [Labilithrix sp.]|nr:hypothetical protein [Labilithrix sp.]